MAVTLAAGEAHITFSLALVASNGLIGAKRVPDCPILDAELAGPWLSPAALRRSEGDVRKRTAPGSAATGQ